MGSSLHTPWGQAFSILSDQWDSCSLIEHLWISYSRQIYSFLHAFMFMPYFAVISWVFPPIVTLEMEQVAYYMVEFVWQQKHPLTSTSRPTNLLGCLTLHH